MGKWAKCIFSAHLPTCRIAHMPTPTISILLPVYNAADTLPGALKSIAAQSFTDFEIVAVDDGSEDHSAVILKAWQKQDDRLLPVFESHRGLIDTLNRGLGSCRGEFIARMDADDLMHADRLNRQVTLLETQPEISVAGCLVETFADGPVGEGMKIYETWLNSLIEHEDITREIFIESPIAHPSAMMRHEELLAMGGYQERGWPEDYDLWLRYHAAGKRFAKVPEILFYWREHERRATRVDSRYSVENFLRAKAYYLVAGPLKAYESLVVWGAGQTGRRLSKHLIREGRAPDVFIDISPKKIGSTLRNIPIIGPDDLAEAWGRLPNPLMVVAVSSRGARRLIRETLDKLDLIEGMDYLCAA